MSASSRTPVFYVLPVLCSIISIQCGAALAKSLFSRFSPLGVTSLRLVFATLILFAVFRPSLKTQKNWPGIVRYGLALGGMNAMFYLAIARIPLGIAVGVEFLGPLLVATLHSKSKMDIASLFLAVLGLCLLLPLHASAAQLDPMGIVYALCAAACWALYIIFGNHLGQSGSTGTVAWGMLIAACAFASLGFAVDGAALLGPPTLPYAIAVGLLSSALPYACEMIALQRLPPKTFGILMSLEPVSGSLAGFFFLGERLTLIQAIAIGCVITASLIASLQIQKSGPPA